MAINRLTDRKIATTAAEAGRTVKLSDGGGLYLAITPSDHRSWKFKFRFAGAEKKLTIGPYPLVTLAHARRERDKAKLQLLDGVDPTSAKRARLRRARIGESFEEIARSWHREKREKLSQRYAAQLLTRLEKDVFARIGSMPIKGIAPADVLEALRAIEDRGARTMAHEVRGHISEIFVWAIASGLAENDPAAPIRKALRPAGGGRHPAVVTAKEARTLIAAIDAMPKARPSSKLASRLLALTAVRPGVIRVAERAEFEGLDGDGPLWRIPARKMKLSQSQKEDARFDFVVPLSRQAVGTVKAAMQASQHSDWIFPGLTGTSPISDSTLSQLYLDAGYRGQHVPHGWRACFSTIMNERAATEGQESDRAIIDLMLAHMKDDVEAAYNRASYMPRRRAIAQEWADIILPPG